MNNPFGADKVFALLLVLFLGLGGLLAWLAVGNGLNLDTLLIIGISVLTSLFTNIYFDRIVKLIQGISKRISGRIERRG